MSQNTQYLTKPRRSSRSRSNSASHSGSSSSKPHDSSAANEIYTPVFQPPNAYAYKIALPTRPKPGMTPWPGHLPPVVGPALGEATNRHRPASISAAAQHSRSSSSNSNSPSDSEPPVLRNRVVSMTRPSPAAPLVSAPPAPPPAQQWTYGLNPLLAPSGGLLWTLRLPVSYIKIRASSLSTPGPLTYNHRAQPVLANHATLSLVVSLPGAAIRVQGDSLGALLDALSDALAAAATPGQWAACDQRSAAAAYQARCGADQAELARGVRRVDLLGPNATFAGLVPAMHAHGAYEWLMQVVVAA